MQGGFQGVVGSWDFADVLAGSAEVSWRRGEE